MKYIELTKGYKTVVDDDDYEKFSKLKWCVRVHPNGRKVACRAERVKGTDKKKNYQLHREILNCPKGMVVDHINGDTLDNRKSNLRVCTIQENSMNRKNQKSNKFRSKYKGVGWRKDRQTFYGRIYHNGKPIILGHSKDEKECARMYNEKAKELFGEYAKLNVIED